MRIAITGASGFVGNHLTQKLEAEGYNLVFLSRKNKIDILNFELLCQIPKCDFIIHLAAETFVPKSFLDPRQYYSFNLNSTINIAELARLWSAKIIFLSSYFYGEPQYLPVDENHPIKPHNPYSRSKYLSEELLKSYYFDFGVKCIALRVFNLYGPGQSEEFLISEILKKFRHESEIILNDPRPKRDYIHVYDLVDAILCCLNIEDFSFEILNIGFGKSYSVKDLTDRFNTIFEKRKNVKFLDLYRKNEVLDSVADIQKATALLAWSPRIDLDFGLKSLIEK